MSHYKKIVAPNINNSIFYFVPKHFFYLLFAFNILSNTINLKEKMEKGVIFFEYPYKLMIAYYRHKRIYFAIISNSLIHCLARMGLISVMCLKYCQ